VKEDKFCELLGLPVWKNFNTTFGHWTRPWKTSTPQQDTALDPEKHLKPQLDTEQDPEKLQHHSLPLLGVHSVRFRHQNPELMSCFLIYVVSLLIYLANKAAQNKW